MSEISIISNDLVSQCHVMLWKSEKLSECFLKVKCKDICWNYIVGTKWKPLQPKVLGFLLHARIPITSRAVAI
jgi:hypothetical protein